ncbi:leucine-rich repeat-containing protein 46-like [Gigantopelta aegis]|uniref:leucine-rich repeat-containing protein 46-like n=1 Tax=Gigantopelta aegis TaxID=1735272 RepID=UPI001B88E130|nr:leucine-rich repeat-containing protein 46-like [Gigantopelta aegis]
MAMFEAGETELIDTEERKPVRLSLHLIVKRHLPPKATSWTQQQILDALAKITRLRLDRENIGYVDSLDLLSENVTHIYLQQNRIERINNFDCLQSIQFLTLSGNRISTIENLSHLKKLLFLDLSSNSISDFVEDELPKSLVLLNLSDNPCTQLVDYRARLIKCLPKLRQLDNEDVTTGEDEGMESNSEEEEETCDVVKDAVTYTPKSAKLVCGEILMRSQNRIEDQLKIHKQHSKELEELKKKLNISRK